MVNFPFEYTKDGAILRIKANPGAQVTEVKGMWEDKDGRVFLKINIAAAPEKGKANKELIRFLADELKVAKSDVEIVGGETDNYKKVLVGSIHGSNDY